MRFYISDLHFWHRNLVFKMDNRPFDSVEEMNEYMIKKWNEKVRPCDEVVICGDFSFGDGEQTNTILRRLNGRKYLIKGNHDHLYLKDRKFDKSLFVWIKDYEELNDNNRKVVLSHYPNIFYNGQYRKDADGNPRTYMLYGHIHNTQDAKLLDQMLELAKRFTYINSRDGKESKIPFNLINVFCMNCDYTPLTLDEWIAKEQERVSA